MIKFSQVAGSMPSRRSDTTQIQVSPVGRLKEAIDFWKTAGANKYILDVISTGYKLPFKEIPYKLFMDNNRSAKTNAEFVEAEIVKLLLKGCIAETNEVPHVVNPLTVAVNKTGK